LEDGEETGIDDMDIDTGELGVSLLLTDKNRIGNIFSVLVKGLNTEDYLYTYQVNDKERIDPYANVVYGRESYGKPLSFDKKFPLKGGFLPKDFDWQDDKPLRIPYSELILYKLNVRGFTIHNTSKVKNQGTFLGVVEKIPYLKELGINCVQVMPIYEFNEIIDYNPKNIDYKNISKDCKNIGQECKVNYWGYCDENQYFAPKASYSSNPYQVVHELKTMIKELHHNGMELIMEMNFPYGTNQGLIQDCLRYWAMEYHVDGFKLTGEAVPITLLATDPLLSNVKMLAADWNLGYIYGKDFVPNYKHLAEYNNAYSVDVRRFLKGDESQVKSFAERFKYNPGKCGAINYITNQDGFTLMDLYSFDLKHNEANGENNLDGIEYNHSWNCGEEGKSKKKKVIQLRKKQIRNALTTLFLSQGAPMLLAGDEFCNSQNGNNNAYCQDNETSWLNWEDLNANQDTFRLVKELISFRKRHPILHMEQILKSMDYISCGFPDLSFHGTKAWYPDYSYYNRMLGIMLAGRYAKINRKENDSNFYLAYNMHWENHIFDLPALPKGMKWHILFDTKDSFLKEEADLTPIEDQKQCEVTARTITILVGK
jgi:glycogen operon protein